MKKIVSIPLTFLGLLLIGSSLIYFGSRNDAVSVAKYIKSGVLTADQVNVAFQNVGGKLVERKVEESQWVKKGDILMVLDDRDTAIAIEKNKAMIDAREAAIRAEELSINIDINETNLTELSTWRAIEELQAKLDAAKATKELAQTEFNRALKLSKTDSISKSAFDTAQNDLIIANMAIIQLESQLAAKTIGSSAEQREKLVKSKNAQDMQLQSISQLRDKIINRKNVLAQLQAQLAQSNADLKQLELNYQRLTLVAPEDGKILKLMYEVGELVPTGAPAVLLETERQYVDIYVNENMVNDYLPKTAVIAYVPAIDRNVNGTVRFATMAPSFADLRLTRERGQADLTSYQIRIYINKMEKLHTGMTIEVDNAKYH
ncbi:HlyD family secretion protein [Orbus mooreae]|uniref:HlyD family secretion protein n=1 Tax=Orbus mooreae TaxID=3074107 RepID=UPI00370D5327